MRMLPLALVIGCAPEPCPDGFLRDNDGNCLQVDGDDADVDADSDSDADGDSDADSDCEPAGTSGDAPTVLDIQRTISPDDHLINIWMGQIGDRNDDVVSLSAGARTGVNYGTDVGWVTLPTDDPSITWTWDNCTHSGSAAFDWSYDPCWAGLDMDAEAPGTQIALYLQVHDATGPSTLWQGAMLETVPDCE